MTQQEIEVIEKTSVAGNAFSDGNLMMKIHDLVVNESSTMDEKMRALRKLNEVMGEEAEITEASVHEYLSYL